MNAIARPTHEPRGSLFGRKIQERYRVLLLMMTVTVPALAAIAQDAAKSGTCHEADSNEVAIIEAGSSIPAREAVVAGLSASPLSAAQNPVSESEPNGTPATATLLGGSSAVAVGNVFPNGDADYWSFTGNAGDRVYAAVQTSFSATSGDSELRLIASNGVAILEFDQDDGSMGSTSSSIAGAVLPATGTYYLRVNNATGAAQIRPYYLHLRVQSGSPAPETEPNDVQASANPLPASGWVSGAHNPASSSEQDWFSFTANAGDTVFLSLDEDPERDGTAWNGRLGIAAFGDAGNLVLVVDDPNAGSPTNPPSEALVMTVKSAGVYYAYVDSASAVIGGPGATYNLSVSVHPAASIGSACQTYSSGPLAIPIGPVSGTITNSTIVVPGNPRIEDLNLSIVLNHTIMQDIDAALISPAGNENSLFTDIGSAASGGQAQMDLDLDDEAGAPPLFVAMKGLGAQPESSYRLDWFKGESAGGPWTLRLRDDANDANGGTLTSWSLTICEPAVATACSGVLVNVYANDFETGDGGFTHSGTQDEWARGLPTAAPVNGCNSGSACWKTDLTGTYNASSNQDLVSPTLSLAGLTVPILVSWAQKYQLENASFDTMTAEVREPGPSNATALFQWLGPTMTDAVGSPATTLNESSGWSRVSRRADAYANRNIQLRWNVSSDSSINLGGLALDDVSVTACCTPESCDDHNPCTQDTCTASGCVHANTVSSCEDGNPCTISDHCVSDACVPGTNPCNDGNACTSDFCDGLGGCTHGSVSCDDNNSCTADACNPASGCIHTAVSGPCSDGNPCTVGDACSGGACVPGPGTPPPISYCNASGITINDSATPPTIATPYPSPILVSTPGGYICSMTVELRGLNHTFPDDIDVLLAAPGNRNAILMSDVGGSAAVAGVDLTVSDVAALSLPDGGPLTTGVFRPTNIDTNDSFPAPAPPPAGGSALSTFTGANPNGVWSLYVVDDAGTDSGFLSGGWCLDIASGCEVDTNCDDGNACTDDRCLGGACQHTNNDRPCEDGSLCTTDDVCAGGTCYAGAPRDCSDGDPCTLDSCSATQGCAHAPSSRPEAVVSLSVGGPSHSAVAWSSEPSSSSYDLVRGSLSALPVGPLSSDELCFGGLAGTSISDAEVPPPGQGFWYLVRGVGCASGPYGMASRGTERTATCDSIDILSPSEGDIVNEGALVVARIPTALIHLIEYVQFEYSSDGTTFFPITGPAPDEAPSASALWATSSLAPGSYVLRGQLKLIGRPVPIVFPSTLPHVTVNAQPVSLATIVGCQTNPGPPTVQFNAGSSFDPDGDVVAFHWTFGDGGSAEGPVVTHVYPQFGQYSLDLTVTDNLGGTTTSNTLIDVADNDQCAEDPKVSCGCASMDIKTSGAIEGPKGYRWKEKSSGIPDDDADSVGPYNDGVAGAVPVQLDMSQDSFVIKTRFEVISVLKPRSKPQLCSEGQRVQRTDESDGSTVNGRTIEKKKDNRSADPRYDSSKGNDDPYNSDGTTDDPAVLEKVECGYGGFPYCDDDYHGGADTYGYGSGDNDPPNGYKRYDGQDRILWLDAPGWRSLTPDDLQPNGAVWDAKFEATVYGPLGACWCLWQTHIAVDNTGKVTKNLVSDEQCSHSFAAPNSTLAIPPDGPAAQGGPRQVASLAVTSGGSNPELGDSRFHYSLERAAIVRIEIVDTSGHVIRTLLDVEQSAGEHDVIWNRTGDDCAVVAPGSYSYRTIAGDWRTSGQLEVRKAP